MNVVITGTTRGLGADLVTAFEAAGHTVWPLSRPACDVTEESSVRVALSGIDESIDLVVNNAGLAILGHSRTLRADDAWRMLETNVFGTWLVSRHAAARMARQGHGSIVSIGSIFGRQAPAGASVYAASKAALEALSASLAKEYAPFGVTVNCLHLSPYDTATMRATGSPEQVQKAIAALPVPRLARIEEVRDAILSLTGNPLITGQTLCMAGVR